MLLKRMDEVISLGDYDCADTCDAVDACLVVPVLNPDGNPPVSFSIVGNALVNRKVLHYDDASDGSNKFIGSYQDFYNSHKTLSDACVYSGGDKLFKQGIPCFGGVAKAAVYLRYSTGVIEFIRGFDPDAASIIDGESEGFKKILSEKNSNYKLSDKWHKFKSDNNKWALVAICRLTDGKYLVPFLESGQESSEYEDLEDLEIDVKHSLELAEFFTMPASIKKYETISDLYQMGTGLGRNPFGRDIVNDKDNVPSVSEYLRLMGVIPKSGRDGILSFLNNHSDIEYPVKIYPSPDTSKMILLPEKGMKFSSLRKVVRNENRLRELYFLMKSNKKNSTTLSSESNEYEELKAEQASYVISLDKCTVFLVNVEGTQKPKQIVQDIIPSVDLFYLTRLNEMLLEYNLMGGCRNYMSIAMTGQCDAKTPAVYKYWTYLFTNALQKQDVSAHEVFMRFQQFARGQKGEDLIDKWQAMDYFRLVGLILQLEHLIFTAKNNYGHLRDASFKEELSKIARFDLTPQKGVFEMSFQQSMSPEDLIGKENYDSLRDWERQRWLNFLNRAKYTAPGKDFALFARGGLVGILLNGLCYSVTREGRRFSATQGRQATRLRGPELTGVFVKGVDLLSRLDKSNLFNGQLFPFIKSIEQESLKDAFNTGLIMGMVFFEGKTNNTDTEEEND